MRANERGIDGIELPIKQVVFLLYAIFYGFLIPFQWGEFERKSETVCML